MKVESVKKVKEIDNEINAKMYGLSKAVWMEVAAYLDNKSLGRMSQACKTFESALKGIIESRKKQYNEREIEEWVVGEEASALECVAAMK